MSIPLTNSINRFFFKISLISNSVFWMIYSLKVNCLSKGQVIWCFLAYLTLILLVKQVKHLSNLQLYKRDIINMPPKPFLPTRIHQTWIHKKSCNKYLSRVCYFSYIILGGRDIMWKEKPDQIPALKHYAWL